MRDRRVFNFDRVHPCCAQCRRKRVELRERRLLNMHRIGRRGGALKSIRLAGLGIADESHGANHDYCGCGLSFFHLQSVLRTKSDDFD